MIASKWNNTQAVDPHAKCINNSKYKKLKDVFVLINGAYNRRII
jgi:hypothetical protein